MDPQIKKGLLDICVLSCMEKGDSYGYKIVSDLSGVVEISESTLYPILRRLEAAGQLQTYQREFNGRLRKYYSITSEGLKKLDDGKQDLKELLTLYQAILGERS